MTIQQWFSIRLGRQQFWIVAFTCTAIRSTVSSGIRWTILKKWADPSSQGRHQFYSYMPAESPTTRFFPVRGMKLDVGLTFQTWWQPFFFSWCCQGATDWSLHQYLGDYQVYLIISRKSRNPSCPMMLNTKSSLRAQYDLIAGMYMCEVTTTNLWNMVGLGDMTVVGRNSTFKFFLWFISRKSI